MPLLLNDSVYPLFASEPSINEAGYRTRYNVQSTYNEINPAINPINRPSTYTFEACTIPGCKEKKDWVALLCMGTTVRPIVAKYLDRTKPMTEIINARFEGQVSYTYGGGTVSRSTIRFFSAREIPIFGGGGGNE